MDQVVDYRSYGQQFRAQRFMRWVGTYRALNQTELWADESGALHVVSDMPVAYKEEVLEFLEERIPLLQLDYLFGRAVASPPGTLFTEDAQRWAESQFDREQVEISMMHPTIWFDDLPLVKRLRHDISLGIGGSDAPVKEETDRVAKRVVANLN